jgi:transcription antitermination factor NusG
MLSTVCLDTASRGAITIVERKARADHSSSRWFAVWTRSRQEKVAATIFQTMGVTHYLPLKSEVRQWSDRKQTIHVPLFAGYLFVRVDPSKDSLLRVLNTPGIAGFVGNSTGPLPIPDQQIDDIRTVLTLGMDHAVLPILDAGDRVRVVRGPLAGIEGQLLRTNSTSRLLISVALIHKSLAVSILRDDVELIRPSAAA